MVVGLRERPQGIGEARSATTSWWKVPFPGTSQARGHPRAEGVPGRCVVDCALERRRLDAELNCIGAPLG